ncbi:acylphosphatase family protein [Terfezia boudieri ATCC MYA-4762]|uniref:acylphosphatase n=1 Tax=Terfezia boudieri ATCC MYA-4762 TaxID=1051890 RepID=A0A3N4LSF9_9PEZI|nr:acylphosphatase family protein [Terfezia boudieri ATCC MYA-4762]
MTHHYHRYTFLVHGTVQGVFFRAYTQRSARAHNISGFVYNTSNGKVAGEAQGIKENLDKFWKDIDRGSPKSHVIRVDKNEINTVEGEEGFEIKKG